MFQTAMLPLELPNTSQTLSNEQQPEQNLSPADLAMIAGGMVVVNTI